MLKALLLTCALCACLAAFAGAQSSGGGAKPPAKGAASRPSSPAQSSPAPSPTAAARPQVTEIKEDGLKSLLGAGAGRVRPLLVNFWATWCGPCREEFPDLVRIRKQYAAEKLDFVIVSLDDPAEIDKAVPEFLAEVRATNFPSYLLHADDDGVAINLVDPTWSGELPATFLYDRSGALVFKHKGRVRAAQLRAALDRVLGEKPQQARARP